MRFQRLDLNLLVALDALLTERSVSTAADRICLSQSATSSALGRLREYFKDDLLVMRGRQMVLTPRAEDLIEPVKAVLKQIEANIALPPDFDPETCDRTIRIMTSDYATEVLLSGALQHFAVAAPHMSFELLPLGEAIHETLERGMIDLLVTIEYALMPNHPSRHLFDDDYVVVGWTGNPQLAQELTRDLYFSLGHVSSKFGKSRMPAFEEWFMRSQSIERRVEVITPTFLSCPFLVVGTQRIATVQRRLAERMAQYLPIKIMELPVEIPPVRIAVQWHRSMDNHPAIRWVVDELAHMAADKISSDGEEMDDIDAMGIVPGNVELSQLFQAAMTAGTRH